MPKLDITSNKRSELRAAAHPLRPVVLIGDRGLSESVLKEIDLNLNAHQLIKVRVAGDDREARTAMYDTICDTLSCAPVHHLGKTLILYRPDLAAERAAAEALNMTRAVRKPSDPYTPKKLAAEGVTRRRRAPKPKSPEAAGGGLSPRARKTSSLSERDAHGIPRRSGSALSLRGGARRPRTGKR
ncbi:YhbY family RNA-binding protein [Allopusillimonas ginsengisoli]|uniref:YhbY family RNA-binding protein n=1 Tax=Allopusillimonas ginsengisoli TaxID=453575 RepID=UPI0010C20EE5|nr:YhbY family RNA-binding protein [Allopusillimonas ginsengisoli]